jgi:hypothetical protein
MGTARGVCNACEIFAASSPSTPTLSLGEREKHLAALVSGVTSVRFLGNKNETFFRWSLRLAFSTVALPLETERGCVSETSRSNINRCAGAKFF